MIDMFDDPTLAYENGDEIDIFIYKSGGLSNMSIEYAQKWFHVKGMLFPGSLFLVVISALTGLLVMLIK